MKNSIFTYGWLVAILMAANSCKEEELVLPEQLPQEEQIESSRRPIKPDYLIFTTDYDEKVQVSFEKADTVKNSKIILVYQTAVSSDSLVVTDFSSPIEITDLPIGVTTEVTVWAEGKNSVLSNPYVYPVKTKPFPSGAVFQMLDVVAGEGEVTVLWQNDTGTPVNIRVELDGRTYESGMNKNASSSLSIEKSSGFYDLSVYVLDSLSQRSNVRDTTIRIVSQIEVDRSNWSATASSSYPGEGPGTPEGVLDGDLNTKWHSSYSPEDLPFPHWLEFDMKENLLINKIQLAPRNDANNSGFLTFNLEGSLDGENWFILHNQGTHDPAVKGLQNTPVSNPREARYLRLNMLTGGANSTHLSEFVAFALQ